MEIEIVLDKNLLNDRDIDFFHYECGYDLAKCDYGTWRINSLGELKCAYIDEERGIYTENIDDIQRYYVRNNEEYEQSIDNGKLVLDLNNWFSIELFDNNGNFIENNYFADSVYGCIEEGYEDFMYHLNKYKNEIIEDLKESGVINV